MMEVTRIMMGWRFIKLKLKNQELERQRKMGISMRKTTAVQTLYFYFRRIFLQGSGGFRLSACLFLRTNAATRCRGLCESSDQAKPSDPATNAPTYAPESVPSYYASVLFYYHDSGFGESRIRFFFFRRKANSSIMEQKILLITGRNFMNAN